MSELTKENSEQKQNRATRKVLEKQKEYMRKFLHSNEMPVLVGNPESLNEDDGKYHSKYLRFLGFSLYQNRNGLFKCTLPKGWRKAAMPDKDDWCYLLDNQGRKRAAICYKIIGAYKQMGKRAVIFSSFVNYMQRFKAVVAHTVDYDIKQKNMEVHSNSPLAGRIQDSETVLFQTGLIEMKYKYGEDFYYQEEREIRSLLYAKCDEILTNLLPDSDNVFLYWNETDEVVEKINNLKQKLGEQDGNFQKGELQTKIIAVATSQHVK